MPKPYGTALLRLRCRSPDPGVSLLKQEVGGAYELLLFRMDKRNLCHGTRPLLTQFRVSASRSPDPLQARHSREGPQEQTFECIGTRSEIDVRRKEGEDVSKRAMIRMSCKG